MILGTGIDIIETARLKQSIEKYDSHFLDHVFTREEQSMAPEKGEARYAFFAGRWAVKEAISKALGTGFCEKCSWTDINVRNLPSGRPIAILSGNAEKTAVALGIAKLHISISHDRSYACATAIAESAD